MPSFFVAPEQVQGYKAVISAGEAHHIKNVLRLGLGTEITLLDGKGNFLDASIENISGAEVHCKVLACRQARGEPPLQVTLIQGLAKGDRMDTVVQKSTELGVAEIWPVFCKRSIQKLEGAKKDSRVQRWQRIAVSAAKQCRRSRIPEIAPMQDLLPAIEQIPSDALILILWEEETSYSLKKALDSRPHPKRFI